MAVTVTVVRGYKDPDYFNSLNPQSSYIYARGGTSGSPGISAHNQLSGLQGGQVSPAQYYHVDALEYQELSAWLSQMTYDTGGDEVTTIQVDAIYNYDSTSIGAGVDFPDGINVDFISDISNAGIVIEDVTLFNGIVDAPTHINTHGPIYIYNEDSSGHEDTMTYIYWGDDEYGAPDWDTYIYESADDVLEIYAAFTQVITFQSTGITLGTGATVDTIETALTDDATHIPTSSAVYDAIGAGVGGIDTIDSVGNPFETILRALQDLGTIQDPAIITVSLGIGTFQYDSDCILEFGRLKFIGTKARLYFEGTTQTVESGLTLTEQSGKEWRYDVTGATFTADEHNEN